MLVTLNLTFLKLKNQGLKLLFINSFSNPLPFFLKILSGGATHNENDILSLIKVTPISPFPITTFRTQLQKQTQIFF